MSLYDQIKIDHLNARKNTLASVSILTTLLGEIQQSLKVDADGAKFISDEDVQKIVAKFIKNNNETLAVNPTSSHLIDENIILSGYLPTQLSETDLKSIIEDFIRDDPSANLGTIMAHLKTNYTGQYDGKLASSIAKSV